MAQTIRPGAAVVVGGAVSKGAFAAGALAHLTLRLRSERTPIHALVGTSSGALNATVVACGVRAGTAVGAAKRLVRLWRDRGGLLDVADLDAASALRLRGASGPDRVLRLLEEACPAPPGRGRGTPVALRIVVAPLAGTGGPRTAFEAVARFDGADLDDRVRRAEALRAAAASAAFPFAFEPVEVEGLGPCVDGGLVDNTPVGEAIAAHEEVGAVYVISADPADASIPPARAARLGGVALGVRLAEMVVNERLVRDLAEARAVNRWIGVLDRLGSEGRLDASARRRIVEGLFPGRDAGSFRRVDVVEIRPERALEGGAFGGFFRRGLRRAWLRAGWEAARAACDARGRRRARAPR
jgi:NTE family protein